MNAETIDDRRVIARDLCAYIVGAGCLDADDAGWLSERVYDERDVTGEAQPCLAAMAAELRELLGDPDLHEQLARLSGFAVVIDAHLGKCASTAGRDLLFYPTTEAPADLVKLDGG